MSKDHLVNYKGTMENRLMDLTANGMNEYANMYNRCTV